MYTIPLRIHPNHQRLLPLNVVVAQDMDELRPHLAAWEELAVVAAEPNVFYEPWAALAALETLGWPASLKFFLVYTREESAGAVPQLCGLFPLEQRSRYRGWPVTVYQLWKHVHCFYCAPLVRPGFATLCLRALHEWFAAHARGSVLWEWLEISGAGALAHDLTNVFHEKRLPSFVIESYNRPLLAPAGDADTYLKSVLSGERRKKLRKQEKRLAESGKVTFAALEPGGDVAAWTDDFLRLEASGWKGQMGTALACSEPGKKFFTQVVSEAFERQRLRMHALRVAGRPVALVCDFLAGDGAFAFKVAFDEAHAACSPGTLLEVEGIREAHARGLRWVDSCKRDGTSAVDHLWSGRRSMQSLLLAGDHGSAALLVSLLPLLRLVKHRAGAASAKIRGWVQAARGARPRAD